MTEETYNPYFVRDVHAAMAQELFSFGSGFSGAGAADLGYGLAGGRPVFAIERDPEAVRTFRRNFGENSVEHRDFREVAASPEIIDRILDQGGLRRGELDILHMSPPCNEYCRLGGGPREGGTAELIFDVVTMAKVVRPRVLIIENVPELGGRYRSYLEAALDLLCFDETGRRIYYAHFMELKAEDYGVAQRRHRLFAIAVRVDVSHLAKINSDIDVLLMFPAPTHAPIPLEVAFAALPQSEEELHPFREAMATSNLGHLARRIPHDPYRWMTPRRAGLGKNRFTTVRAAIRLPGPTLTASGQQPDGRSGVLHSFEHRKLSLREMMRSSSFPDDFTLTGTVGQAATRIGMCVPPLMAKAVAQAIYEGVLKPYHDSLRGPDLE